MDWEMYEIMYTERFMDTPESNPEGYKETSQELAQDRRLLGISLNDVDVLQSFSAQYDNGAFSAIDQRVTSKGVLHGAAKNKFFTATELTNLLALTNELIKGAAVGMYSGAADITPIESGPSIHVCEYCEYKSVCLLDPGFDGNSYREIPAFEKSDLEVSDER